MASKIVLAPNTPKSLIRKSPKRFLHKVTAHGVIRKELKKNQISNLKYAKHLNLNTKSKLHFKKPTSSLLVRVLKYRKQLTNLAFGINIEPLDIAIDKDGLQQRKTSLIKDVEIKDDKMIWLKMVDGEETQFCHTNFTNRTSSFITKRVISLLKKHHYSEVTLRRIEMAKYLVMEAEEKKVKQAENKKSKEARLRK
ncbi:hypothetical protein AgCh_017352 [Apium graveolens]